MRLLGREIEQDQLAESLNAVEQPGGKAQCFILLRNVDRESFWLCIEKLGGEILAHHFRVHVGRRKNHVTELECLSPGHGIPDEVP